MNNIRLKRWMADPAKAVKISNIVNDSTFMEAVELIKSLALPPIPPQGANQMEAAAMGLAFQNGIEEAFRRLENISRLTKDSIEKGKQIPNKRPTPWEHVNEEGSVFSKDPDEEDKKQE